MDQFRPGSSDLNFVQFHNINISRRSEPEDEEHGNKRSKPVSSVIVSERQLLSPLKMKIIDYREGCLRQEREGLWNARADQPTDRNQAKANKPGMKVRLETSFMYAFNLIMSWT
jgi:hypothetical protein